jgi:hypothetical protein
MPEKVLANEQKVGEELAPLEIKITEEFNEAYLDSLEDRHLRYMQETEAGPPIVHPGLLHNWSHSSRSPAYSLPKGTAGVMAKDEMEFINPARVGKTLKITWKVIETYEKGGRKHAVRLARMVDEDGIEILRRKIDVAYVTREAGTK